MNFFTGVAVFNRDFHREKVNLNFLGIFKRRLQISAPIKSPQDSVLTDEKHSPDSAVFREGFATLNYSQLQT